jgi:c-di-GMP-related signal transduction protein
MPEEQPVAAPRSYIARHPIFDPQLKVHAYELLFRSGLDDFFFGETPEQASRKVIADSSLLTDLETLTSGKPAFYNVTADAIHSGFVSMLPKELAVIEIGKTVEPNQELIQACQALHKAGYTFALDDFVFREELQPLIDLADIIKVDVLATDRGECEALVKRFQGTGVRLLAEKVETREMFNETRELGYALFQGFFFSRPQVVTLNDIPGFKLHYLNILKEINRPDLDFDQLEQLIRQDVSMTYKLLRYINSAHFSFRGGIDSIRQALRLLGEKEIKKWASLVAITNVGREHPEELLRQAIIRARFCESLAGCFDSQGQRFGGHFDLPGQKRRLFLMGLLSLIDVFLGRPLPEILEPLPLEQEIKQALMGESNQLGKVLRCAVAQEQGDWDRLERLVGPDQESIIASHYLEATAWATSSLGAGMARDD